MRTRTCSAALLSLVTTATVAVGQTAFTYQGQLKDGGGPASGSYNLVFTLWNAASGGSQIGGPDNEPSTSVQDGVFTVQLNDSSQFGGSAFDGNPRWVQVSVNGMTLSPRQPVTAAPYAHFAFDAPSSGGGGFWSANGTHIYKNNSGNVGIGATDPQTNLEVRSSGTPRLRIAKIHAGGFGVTSPALLELKSNFTGTDFPYGVVRFMDGSDVVHGSIEYGSGPGLLSPVAMRFGTEGATRMSITSGGDVGIGTIAPDVRLHIAGGTDTALASGQGFLVLGDVTGANVSFDNNEIMARDNEAVSNLFLNHEGGNVLISALSGATGRVGIGTGSPNSRLHVSASNEQLAQFNQFGNSPGMQVTSISGTTNYPALSVAGFSSNVEAFRVVGQASIDVLKITGADVAEKFPTSETGKIDPGTVMEIDPDCTGKLRIANGAYTKRVAGVVSGAGDIPLGAVLGNLPGHEDAPPIALSGRVWVKCDAGGGAIEPGDLLTTSDTPGHAMKAADPTRAHGAVIGKAMSALSDGSGLVLVLVNLQ